MTTHTRPLRVVRDAISPVQFHLYEGDVLVATVHDARGRGRAEVFAAAPEMVALLRDLDKYSHAPTLALVFGEPFVAGLRALLAKIDGGGS